MSKTKLATYSNHELSLENKFGKMIPYDFMVRGKSSFVEADTEVVRFMWYKVT